MAVKDRPLGRSFWTFWGAAALANLGDGIRVAAFPLLAAALTDSPIAVAAVAAAQFLPWLIAGLVAGSLADNRGPRGLIAFADSGRVVILLTLTVSVATGWVTVPLVVVSAFLLGVGETLRDTAAQTAVPRLVPDEQLEKANGRLVAGEIMGNEFVGPPVGAFLFVAGAALPFAVNGGALALAVMLVLSLPLSLTRPDAAPSEHAEGLARPGSATSDAGQMRILAGLHWLARQPMLRTLVIVAAAVAAADSAWFAIFVLYAQERLGMGSLGFGMLLATGAAGGLAGSFAADRLIGRFRHRRVLAWSLAITAGIPTLLVVAPNRTAAVAVVISTSASFAILNVAALSMRQRIVPGGLLGRVVAASRMLTFTCSALGALLGGALAAGVGLDAPFLFSGVIAIIATGAWLVSSRRAVPGNLA
ncbi:MAG TPA: MFS transporter [Micromonosporaceae bacterium]|nr:MFS transporter [Micromonosporaceae bacterium]